MKTLIIIWLSPACCAAAELTETDARLLGVMVAPVSQVWASGDGWTVVFSDGRRMTLREVTGGAVGMIDESCRAVPAGE